MVFDMEEYVKVVKVDNVSLKSFVFFHHLMVEFIYPFFLPEERIYELTKTLMYHESLKPSIYSSKKVSFSLSVVTFLSIVDRTCLEELFSFLLLIFFYCLNTLKLGY